MSFSKKSTLGYSINALSISVFSHPPPPFACVRVCVCVCVCLNVNILHPCCKCTLTRIYIFFFLRQDGCDMAHFSLSDLRSASAQPFRLLPVSSRFGHFPSSSLAIVTSQLKNFHIAVIKTAESAKCYVVKYYVDYKHSANSSFCCHSHHHP